jgi:hypothetical protein
VSGKQSLPRTGWRECRSQLLDALLRYRSGIDVPCSAKSGEELINHPASPPDQAAQYPAGDLLMVRNRERRDVSWLGK